MTWLKQPVEKDVWFGVSDVDFLLHKTHLVGGWTNPFEKYARQNGFIFPK